MTELVVLVILGMIIVAASKKNKKRTFHEKLRFKKKKRFFTKSEYALALNLEKALPEFRILSKTRLADIVEPNHAEKSFTYQRAFNQISRKHLDFVLLDKNFAIVGAIELDGKSHNDPKQQKRDEVKNMVMNEAEVPLYRFIVGEKFTAENIRSRLSQILPKTDHQ